MSNELWIAGIVLIILGLFFAIAGKILNTYAVSSRPYEGYAEAKVVEIISLERDRNMEAEFRNRQAAVFEFYANGRPVKVVDREDAYPCPYVVNQRVHISYDPACPESFSVLHRENKHEWSTACNAAAVLVFVLGILLFLRYALRYL